MPIIAKKVKEEILSKVKIGEKVSELSKKYGVSEGTIYSWLHLSATSLVSVAEYNRLKKENEELKAIAGALMFQLEKSKKKK